MTEPTKQTPSAASLFDRAAAYDAYRALHEANPHLPPAWLMAGDQTLQIALGPKQIAALTLTVFVRIPEAWREATEPS